MDEKSAGQHRSLKLWIGTVLAVLIMLALLVGARTRWVQPIPGVSLDMSPPPVTEEDLGPDSAYRLLLRAISSPPVTSKAYVPVWGKEWLAYPMYRKVQEYGWPAQPPPTLAERVAELKAADAAEPVKDAEEKSTLIGPLKLPPENRALEERAPWTREQYDDAKRIFGICEQSVRLLDQALAAPNPQMPTAQTKDTPPSYLPKVRSFAFLLSAAASARMQEGDYMAGAELLVRSVRMGNLVCRGGGFTHHLAGRSCIGTATLTATNLALSGKIPADVLEHMARQFLICADDTQPFVEALRAEAHATIEGVDQFYSKLPPALTTSGATFVKKLCRYPFVLPLLRSTPTETKRSIAACYQNLVAQEVKGPSSGAAHLADLQREFAKKRSKAEILLRVHDPLGIVYAERTIGRMRQGRNDFLYRDANLRGTAVLLAAMAYHKEHGQYPKDLEALVPDYLPRVPIDPFSGKPLLCLPGNPTEWAVYSVGPDGKDDGARDSVHMGMMTSIVPKGDIIWHGPQYSTVRVIEVKELVHPR